MDELKPCPFCGEPLYIKVKRYTKPLLMPATRAGVLRDELIDITGEEYVPIKAKYCPLCGRALDRRAEPENKPLTLDELRQMNGKPVWIKENDLYAILSVERYALYVYGKYGMDIPFCWNVKKRNLTLYARKPEGSEKG